MGVILMLLLGPGALAQVKPQMPQDVGDGRAAWFDISTTDVAKRRSSTANSSTGASPQSPAPTSARRQGRRGISVQSSQRHGRDLAAPRSVGPPDRLYSRARIPDKAAD